MSKAETLEDLRIPEEGNINTLIGKLVAHYLSDDSPEIIDDHKETYNAAIDHVEELIERRIAELIGHCDELGRRHHTWELEYKKPDESGNTVYVCTHCWFEIKKGETGRYYAASGLESLLADVDQKGEIAD